MRQIKNVQEEIFDIVYTASHYKLSKEIHDDMQERLNELSIKMKNLKAEKQKIDNIVPDVGCLGDKAESIWVLDKNNVNRGIKFKRN